MHAENECAKVLHFISFHTNQLPPGFKSGFSTRIEKKTGIRQNATNVIEGRHNFE